MVDLTKEERTLLARLEKSDAFVYRQAEHFTLVYGGYMVCVLDTNTCRRLIDLGCLVEIGKQVNADDDTDWIYGADPSLFAPNFVISDDE